MADHRHSQYKRLYKHEFEFARAHLAADGGTVEWSPHDFEAFTYKAPGVSLVFYPHKTTANNRHIRVRDNGSKDKTRAAELMTSLWAAHGYECTFSRKC